MDVRRAVRAVFQAAAAVAVGVCATTGCGDGEREGVVDPPQGPVEPGPGPHFTVSPVPIETLGRITALGFNNNVLPTDHTYWETCESWVSMRLELPCHLERQPLRAPGDGTVRSLDPAEDGYIEIEGPPGLVWTFGHVTPSAGLSPGAQVTAGQVVARMFYEQGFDFGLTNYGVEHRYIVPAHYSDQGLHGQHPVAQFPPTLRTELLTRMNPTGPELGRLSYDSAGTASGTWVTAGSGPIYFTNLNQDRVLWLGRWTERPDTRVASFGEIWPGMENRIVATDPAAPAWEEIEAGSGPVALRLWHLNAGARPNLSWSAGTLLVEVLDELTLRVEWFSSHDDPPGFTTSARTFER